MQPKVTNSKLTLELTTKQLKQSLSDFQIASCCACVVVLYNFDTVFGN